MGRKTIINSITSPELLKKINPKNIRLKNDFITYLKTIGRAEKTVCSYINDLDIFFTWNMQNNDDKFFVDLTKRDIISFQDWLINVNENSPARVRRLKSTLSSLSNYIESILDDDFPTFKSIIRKIESPISQPVREKTVLTEEQVEYLLSYLAEKGKYQKACAVALAAYSGARKSELTRFKTEYFVDENIIFGSLYKTPEKIQTKGRGVKGKLLFKYVIVDKFKPYLELWLKQREELNIDSEWLFVTKYGSQTWEKAKPETFNSWAQTNTKILGIPFYFHSLRHYFCTMLARNSLPDSIIQEVIGWDSAEMVKIYKDIPTDEQLEKYFDENGIKPVEQAKLSEL